MKIWIKHFLGGYFHIWPSVYCRFIGKLLISRLSWHDITPISEANTSVIIFLFGQKMKLQWVKTNENNQIMKIPFTHNLTLDTQRVNQTPPYSKILTTKPYTPQPLIPKLYILHNNILPSQTSWYLNKMLYTTISLLQ